MPRKVERGGVWTRRVGEVRGKGERRREAGEDGEARSRECTERAEDSILSLASPIAHSQPLDLRARVRTLFKGRKRKVLLSWPLFRSIDPLPMIPAMEFYFMPWLEYSTRCRGCHACTLAVVLRRRDRFVTIEVTR